MNWKELNYAITTLLESKVLDENEEVCLVNSRTKEIFKLNLCSTSFYSDSKENKVIEDNDHILCGITNDKEKYIEKININ